MDEILFPPDKRHQPVVQKQDGENYVLDLGTLGAEGHGIRVFSPTHIFPRQNQRFRQLSHLRKLQSRHLRHFTLKKLEEASFHKEESERQPPARD